MSNSESHDLLNLYKIQSKLAGDINELERLIRRIKLFDGMLEGDMEAPRRRAAVEPFLEALAPVMEQVKAFHDKRL
jgi:hypothetical protein